MKVQAATPRLLTDGEVCNVLRISRTTLNRLLREGPPKNKPGAGDLREIKTCMAGNQRRWVKSSLEKFVGEQLPDVYETTTQKE